MNGYNFTERVRKVLAMAREEAARLHHEYVGTEHILLGIIREGEGVAMATLQARGVDTDAVAARIDEAVKRGKADTFTGLDLPYTSRAKKALELAMAEARELNHSYVGTEHLLLGLIREEKGIAAQVLQEHGLTGSDARKEVLRLLGTGTPSTRPAAVLPDPPGNRPIAIMIHLDYGQGRSYRQRFRTPREAIAFLTDLPERDGEERE